MHKSQLLTAYYATVVSIGGFLFGFDASVISGVLGFIIPELDLNAWEVGLVVSAPTLGGLMAALLSGPISDYAGRKKVLIGLAVLYTVSAVGSALAPNYETLVAARFIGGLAFTSLGIAPMYIAEIAPAEKRGLFVSFNQFNIMIGFSAAYFINYFLLEASQRDVGWVHALMIDRHPWRWMLGLGAVPAVLWLVLLFLVPESPRWLALKGRISEAGAVLAKIRPADRVANVLQEITASVAEPAGSLASRVAQLFRPAMKLPLAIGLAVGIVQQVTGINAIYFYAPTIFEQSGVGTNAAFAQATLIGIINIIFTVLAMALIDRLGRRVLLLAGLTGVIVSTALAGYGFREARYELTQHAASELSAQIDAAALGPVIGVEYADDLAYKNALTAAVGERTVKAHEAELIGAAIHINPTLVLVGILAFVASFAISLGPVMWVLFSEIFPNRIRGIAMAFVGFFNGLASFAVQFLFPWQLSNLGSAATFFGYALFGVVGLALIAWLLPETKGRTLEELEIDLAGGTRAPAVRETSGARDLLRT